MPFGFIDNWELHNNQINVNLSPRHTGGGFCVEWSDSETRNRLNN